MQPRTCFIAYGADLEGADCQDGDEKYARWLQEHGLKAGEYYLVVGRFVPENNFATMIREYMASQTTRPLALVTNQNGKFSQSLEQQLGFSKDDRIRFVGTVYDAALLRRIRENARVYDFAISQEDMAVLTGMPPTATSHDPDEIDF
jgi:rhamnosyltransferase